MIPREPPRDSVRYPSKLAKRNCAFAEKREEEEERSKDGAKIDST